MSKMETLGQSRAAIQALYLEVIASFPLETRTPEQQRLVDELDDAMRASSQAWRKLCLADPDWHPLKEYRN